jgi:ABC-2 type transport system ATP-binding protein
MSVRGYLLFTAQLRGLSRSQAEKQVPEAMAQTQLGDVADDPIASLSHGFKQRVGIAQAIVHRPRLLVLDEPITGLDPVQIVEMRALLLGLKGKHTILLSSHILSEISETCDRILVIKDGQIAASGTEAELTAKLMRGHVEITVREHESSSAGTAREIAEKLDGVREVEVLPPSEAGFGVVTLRVFFTERDVREQLCKALVGAGIGILQIGLRERELESVFLNLAGPGDGRGTASTRGVTREATDEIAEEEEQA